ncbi:MAG TPA: hypothetical protein VIV11_32020 [Kofleriaceae bacterium]
MRVLLLALALIGCAKKPDTRQLDFDKIRVTSDAKLRTDTVGDGKFTDLSTFVLVEAENMSEQGAYVTLAGELTDETGKQVGELRAQSLWIPGGELRTFALVDKQRKPRPDAKAAKIYVRGAQLGQPPPARVEGLRQVDDHDKVVLQATIKNEAARGGDIMVIAAFYDANGKPMTRPFSMLWVDKSAELPVQFVGPVGSKRGTIFIGDVAY